jgi:predicted DNA-binding transcriptional regulator YafY
MKKSLWLARLLYNNGPLSKQQILQAWCREDESGRPMANTTFYDNCRYIKRQLGLRLERRDGRYHIDIADQVDPLLRQMLTEDATTPQQSTADLVLIYSKQIIEAMEMRHCVQIEYASTHRAPYVTEFEPYCVRSIRGFLYTVGYSCHHGEVRIFALDRINYLRLLPQRYKIPADFNGDAYFRDSFGAFAGQDIHSERIILQVVSQLGKYLRRRPLHESQRMMERHQLPQDICPVDDALLSTIDDTDPPSTESQPSCFVEIRVAITRDLIAELLSYGPELRVLAPATLAERVQMLHRLGTRG